MGRRDDELARLARDLSRRVARYDPDWTDTDGADPGITLLELIAFLGESVLVRAEGRPDTRIRWHELLTRLERLDPLPCPDATLTRSHFFQGQVLTSDDLTREQDYHRAKHRRHNRLLHGTGIVRGLGVSLEPGPPTTIVVSPGLAIDPLGEELVICDRVTVDTGPGGGTRYLTVALVDRPVGQTPGGEASSIEESAAVAVVDAITPGHLAIARLVGRDGAWSIDATFEPVRA